MSNLKNRYQEIFEELENHIQDEKEKEFVMCKFQELSIMFMDVIDRLTYITDLRMQDVEEKQKEMEEKICNVQNAVNGIESDIYEDVGEEEAFEFEIVCPYCNNEFSADIDCNMNTEIECPECHNVIELDWNEDEECEHDCSCCSHDCMEEEEEIENKKQNNQEENNQDDM